MRLLHGLPEARPWPTPGAPLWYARNHKIPELRWGKFQENSVASLSPLMNSTGLRSPGSDTRTGFSY